MDAPECYCAICGCLIIGENKRRLQRGSKSQKAKRIRKEVVENGLRQRAGMSTKNDYEYEYSDDDKGLCISDLENSHKIQHSYDPEVMECRDFTLPNYHLFINHVRLVTRDSDIEGSPMCFISGAAEVDDYGTGSLYGILFEHHILGPEPINVYLYEQCGTVRGFPCHGLCLQILAKAVVGKPDSRLLNPEVLYEIMCDARKGGTSMLGIDYGDISGHDQWWNCMPGEEYAVINPLEFYDEHMRTLTSLTIEPQSHEKQMSQVGTRNVTTDPFHALSNELIHHIASYLGGNDVRLLRQASMIVRDSTSGKSYWKARVQQDMPWLWVPSYLYHEGTIRVDESKKPQIDWMKVYLLFDSVTARPWGMSGKYMGLANRRRIWNACEQLRSLYTAYAAQSGHSLINPDVNRCTWSEDDEIDTLWREAFDELESDEHWA